MASILRSIIRGDFKTKVIRTGTAQASTGQTDWFSVPDWCTKVYIEYSLTAVAGTTPLVDVAVWKTLDTTPSDDTGAAAIHAAFTQITGAATLQITVDPSTPLDVTTAATGVSDVRIPIAIPRVMGVKVLNDRTTGDETYTYTVTVRFE